jgi:poly-gamma-glutamate capsule biosynthesis protein CapA/YwtB (metallophosphatase superfamily)
MIKSLVINTFTIGSKMCAYSKGIRIAAVSTLSLALVSGFLLAQSFETESPATKVNNDNYITITAVGDIMMGTTYPSNYLPPEDGRGMFAGVQERLKSGDIVFGNLEGPLVDNGIPTKCKSKTSQCFEFVTPTRYAGHLKEAGFTVMNIANNHTFDCGVTGAENTVNTLKATDIEVTGGTTIARVFVKGKHVAIAGFSFMLSDNAYSIHDIDTAKDIIKKLKEESDIVIVSFHGGAEGKSATRLSNVNELFLGEQRGNVMKFSHAVIDAGADLVLGHGPHVLRAMEVYKGKLIAYSLGNFLTYNMFNVKGPNGLSTILSMRMNTKNGEFIDGTLIPLRLTKDGIPEMDPAGEATKLLRKLTRQDIKTKALLIDEIRGSLSLAN